MADATSRVTIHMVASLDGFIARRDGSVDWLETSDKFVGGDTLDPAFVAAFLKTIDCYVMGSRTYETALSFEAKGSGWAYGDTPTFVLTRRQLPRTRDTVEFYSGDLAQFVNGRLRPAFRSIWFVGGGAVSSECLRLGLADEVRYAMLPILIGDGIPFFDRLERDISLHLADVKAYESGMVELRYEVQGRMPANLVQPLDAKLHDPTRYTFPTQSMTAAEIRRLALSLPEAVESSHMGHPDFRVANKIFATLGYPSRGWGVVMLTPDQQDLFVRTEPAAFAAAKGAWGRRGSTTVHLQVAQRATVRESLIAAWRNRAPSRLAGELEL